MERVDINSRRTVLTISIAGLRFCGIWRLDSSTPTYLKHLHFLSSILGIIMMLILIATIIADLILNFNDLLIVTDNGCYLAGLSVILFKVFKFHNHHEKIQRLTEAIYKPIENIQQSTDPAVLTILGSNTFYENLGFSFFTSMGGILMIALIFFVPKSEGQLPIRATYPFDTAVSPIHQLAVVTQMYAVGYGLTSILLMDTIGLGFMRWINVQLVFLTSNFQNCTPSLYYPNQKTIHTSRNVVEMFENDTEPWTIIANNVDSTEISTFLPFMEYELGAIKNGFRPRYKRCVINHRRLIDIIDDVNETFSSSMLMQLFSSFTMICLTGFQAVLGSKEKSNLMKFAIYLGAAFTQLLYWCWYGNELLYQKQSLFRAQWMSGWENQLNSNSKILIIMSMIRTMQPLELKAGAFFTMSMETFITVVKSSYSFFALLMRVTNGKD